jgi:hydroxyethylthiazole kinase-like uncharacterized protein yjeF
MEILTAEEMRNVDRRAIDTLGIPGAQLMETAGKAVAAALLVDYPQASSLDVLVVCGKGNNGGDGFVAARYLAGEGVRPRVVLLANSDQVQGDAATQLAAMRSAGIELTQAVDAESWAAVAGWVAGADLIVDAILGTGVRGGARGLPAQAIQAINDAPADVVCIDLPSGLDADRCEIDGSAVRATRTYTLCRPKLPLLLAPAASLAGEIRVLPIGIPNEAVQAEASDLEWIDEALALESIPPRPSDSHKGTYGHLLAVAGSPGKSGAAVLLARAALRSGVGLVTVASFSSSLEQIAVQQAEIMTEPLPETPTGGLTEQAATRACTLSAARDAVALGPGLGTQPATVQLVRTLLSDGKAPMVIDADGLNACLPSGAETESGLDRLRTSPRPLVLTPHPGEAARLLDCTTAQLQADRLAAARRLARESGSVVVLKGHRSLVAEPTGRVAVNTNGNPGMATAGMGDVLTGIVGACLARGLAPQEAARLAVYVHGMAGDRAARIGGQDGLIASDVIDELPATWAALRERST